MSNRPRPEPAETIHFDVAGYALGVLDPADAERCEWHLTECAACAAELELFLPVSSLLADVDPRELGELEDPAMLERLTCAVRKDRRVARRRHRLVAATTSTVAAAAAGLALLAGASWLDSSPDSPLAGETPAPATASPGELFSATDPHTGAHAEVQLRSRPWGTHVSLSLSSVTGPLECQVLLVYADGSAEVAGSWRVPDHGYGTAQQPNPLTLEAAVAADRADLSELRITATAPGGSVGTLVGVPL